MKQFIIIVGIAVITMITAMTLMSQEGRISRKDELNRATSAAIKQTVKKSQSNIQKEIKNDKDMVSYFTAALCSQIKSDGDIEIKVLGVDYQEGMLDVVVTERFDYLNGKEGIIKVRKCAIYD